MRARSVLAVLCGGLLLAASCGGDDEELPDGQPVAGETDGASAIDAVATQGNDAPAQDAPAVDAPMSMLDAGGNGDGGTAGVGELCGAVDGGVIECQAQLVCCYPCGIPGCSFQCQEPCAEGGGCVGGCPLLP